MRTSPQPSARRWPPPRSTPPGSETYPRPSTAVFCQHLEASVVAVFAEAEGASQGLLSFRQKRDANGSAIVYGLAVQRDAYTKACLFIRIDAVHLQTWWQLHEGGNLEHALGGWWNLPVLAIEDQDAFLQAKVLDLIWTLRESPSAHRSRF